VVLHFVHPSKAALSPGTFAKKFFYSPSFDSDYIRVVAVAKKAGKDQTRMHCLLDEHSRHYGFIALSITISVKKPCLVIDYLFVSQQYRGICYPELGDQSVADLLIASAYTIASEANKNFPIRYIALVPANDRLEAYYTDLDFCKLDSTDFMYLRL
jgi:hypothetical protein